MSPFGESSPAQDANLQWSSLQDWWGNVFGVLKNDEKPNSETCEGKANDKSSVRQSAPSAPVQPKSITWIKNFNEKYVVGEEVMHTGNLDTQVHFARRRSDGEDVVVKLRLKPKAGKSMESEHIWREIHEQLMNMTGNAGLAGLHEVLEDDNAFYIVMEKVNGIDLCEIVSQEDVSVTDARGILLQLLTALEHLHSHNVVHKDIKLENIMVESVGDEITPKSSGSSLGEALRSTSSVKVIDFDTLDRWSPKAEPAKRGSPVVGTNQYIAQEAYAGKYSPASDIFAVGVIAYKLLTSKWPFPDTIFDDEAGENWVGSVKMRRIQLRLKNATVSFAHNVFRQNPQARALVQQMLSYKEDERPTAAAALQHPWLRKPCVELVSI